MNLGVRDTLDLRLEFSGSRANGTATNWVYDDNGDLDAVGAATISARRVRSYAARDLSPAATRATGPKTVR